MAGRCGRDGKVPGRPDDAVVILMCRGQNRRKIRFSEEELEGRFKDKVTRDFWSESDVITMISGLVLDIFSQINRVDLFPLLDISVYRFTVVLKVDKIIKCKCIASIRNESRNIPFIDFL